MPNFDFNIIGELFSNYSFNHPAPHVVYAMAAGGKILHSNQYNLPCVNRLENPNQTAFRIASMTKSFGAAAAIILRDRQKIKLEQTVEEFFPGSEIAEAYRDITIRQLLSHTSMLPGNDDPWADRQTGITDEEFLKILKKEAIREKSRNLWEYSNLGYMLLGMVIARASGQSSSGFITENILKPLGMNNTVWNMDSLSAANYVKGYRAAADFNMEFSELVEEDILICRSSADIFGGLCSTLEDLAIWTDFFTSVNHVSANNQIYDQVLCVQSRIEMQTPSAPVELRLYTDDSNGMSQIERHEYCFGLGKTHLYDKVFIGHSGGFPGYGSHMRWEPQSGYSIIALGNATYNPVFLPCKKALYYWSNSTA